MKICGRRKRNHVSDEITDLEDQPAPVEKKRCNPCRFCCGLKLKTWALILGVFDIVSGFAGLAAATTIIVLGDLKKTTWYPFESFNLPREFLFAAIFVTIYNIMCGTLLMLAITCKDSGGVYAWLLLTIPMLVNPLKIGESVIVYRLSKQIRQEEKAMEYYYSRIESGKQALKKQLIVDPVNVNF